MLKIKTKNIGQLFFILFDIAHALFIICFDTRTQQTFFIGVMPLVKLTFVYLFKSYKIMRIVTKYLFQHHVHQFINQFSPLFSQFNVLFSVQR